MPDYKHYTDHELLNLLAQADIEAFREIYDRFFPEIYGAACSYLPDREACHDVVQDIFIKIWEKRTEFAGIENLNAYLYRTARNFALNALEKSLQARKREDAYAKRNKQDERSTERYIAQAELRRLLEDTMILLPKRQRQVYQLAKIEELSYEEIAAQLHISRDTVRLQLIAANKFVRKHLLKYYHHDLQAMVILVFLLLVS